MSILRPGRNDPCPCGSGKKYKHCCGNPATAAPPPPAAPAPMAPHLAQLLTDTVTHYRAGRRDEAEAAGTRLLREVPGQPGALQILALVAYDRGQFELALQRVDAALAGARNDNLFSIRGLALQALGRIAEAVTSFEGAVALNPMAAPLWAHLGGAQLRAGAFDAAQASLERALALDARLAVAHNDKGLCQLGRGQPDAAIQSFRDALAVQPRYADALANLGIAYWHQRRLQEALAHYRQALDVEPRHLVALDNLWPLLAEANQTEEAAECLRRAAAIDPSVERRLQAALMLPPVAASKAEMLASRARFEAGLAQLAAAPEVVSRVTPKLFCNAAFYLAYHGLNDRDLRSQLSAYYERLCPSLRHVAPSVSDDRPRGERLKVGFFSVFVHDHPVTRCFAATIQDLSNDERFEVFLISPSDLEAARGRGVYHGFGGRLVRVSSDLESARQAIGALGLDVLVYQDIGMEYMSFFMAHARLARWQCSMGGHPETTGIAAIDYFLSTRDCESDDADAHYVETLVRLPVGVAQYREPAVPPRLKTRAELGLPTSGALYLCPMMLQKLHPDFDDGIAALLERDPAGHVMLFEHDHLPWHETVARRLDAALAPSLRRRVLFHPWIRDSADFMAINAAASVVVDPFHFGIGSTAITTFAVGTPVVTWPGEFMRGRGGLGYNRLLGLDDCIASDRADYVSRAVGIANDPDRRQAISRRIAENKHLFFGNRQAVDDLARFLLGLRAQAQPAAAEART